MPGCEGENDMKRAMGKSVGADAGRPVGGGRLPEGGADANTAGPIRQRGRTRRRIATNSPPVEAMADADVKAFLDGIYAHYKSSKNNTFQPFEKHAKECWIPTRSR